jgi:molybdopterin converting factor subunit 1
MITVKLFGIAREIVGSSSIVIEEATPTVEELLEYLKSKFPQLNKLTSLLVAVNSEYAAADREISTNDEIAIIPPVSGG